MLWWRQQWPCETINLHLTLMRGARHGTRQTNGLSGFRAVKAEVRMVCYAIGRLIEPRRKLLPCTVLKFSWIRAYNPYMA